MRYTLDHRISHADVDFLGEFKVPALLGLLERAAVEASTAAGFDAARYTREGRIWLIRRTRLERLVPVGGTETLAAETQVVDFRRARSLRRYTLWRDTLVVARATSDWVYCDLHSGRPSRIPTDLQHALVDGATCPALPRAPALPDGGDGAPVALDLTVQPSHLDHVAHVNNAVYAAFLEDGASALFAARGWPLERMLALSGALRIRWLDVEYLSDAVAGNQLTIRSWLQESDAFDGTSQPWPRGARLLQTITRSDGATVIRAQSDWVWRRKPVVVGGVPEA